MADDTPHGEDTPAEPGNEAPNEPETTDWKSEARKWEKRAKENLAKADANEEAARRLAEIEEQSKSELQKAQERADAAEARLRERDEAERAAQEQAAREAEIAEIAAEIATTTGVPAAALRGTTREEIAAHAEALKPLLGKPLVIEGQEQTPDTEPSEESAFVRGLFSGGE